MYGDLLTMANHLRKLVRPVVVLGLLTVIAITPLEAFAATTPPLTGQALEIGPPVLNLTANPGDTLHSSIELRDISSSSLVVTNQVNDFTAQGEDGTPKVILDPSITSPYSFKTWLASIPTINLKSRDVKTVPITIVVPQNASPGGYYGIVRFTGTAPQVNGTGVSLNASLGALIFIRVKGTAQENVSISEFSSNNGKGATDFFQSTPFSFLVRLQNNGNLYEQPTGLITITDMFNHTVATLPVNEGQSIILPQTIRKFNVSLDSSVLGDKVLFGKYHAHLDVTYGANSQKISRDMNFTVLPVGLMLGGAILVIILIVILGFAIRRYNKYIVSRAGNK